MNDPRYRTIKILLEAGAFERFSEIFGLIPHSVIAKDFQTSNARMKEMINDPGNWKLKELHKLADLIDYDKGKLVLMAVQEAREKEDPDA